MEDWIPRLQYFYSETTEYSFPETLKASTEVLPALGKMGKLEAEVLWINGVFMAKLKNNLFESTQSSFFLQLFSPKWKMKNFRLNEAICFWLSFLTPYSKSSVSKQNLASKQKVERINLEMT